MSWKNSILWKIIHPFSDAEATRADEFFNGFPRNISADKQSRNLFLISFYTEYHKFKRKSKRYEGKIMELTHMIKTLSSDNPSDLREHGEALGNLIGAFSGKCERPLRMARGYYMPLISSIKAKNTRGYLYFRQTFYEWRMKIENNIDKLDGSQKSQYQKLAQIVD